MTFMRCDGCPAKAVVQWVHPEHGVIVLCAAHAAHDADVLDAQGWEARELARV